MKILLIFAVAMCHLTLAKALDIRYVDNRAQAEAEDVEEDGVPFKPGTTYILRSIMDGSVVTVHSNGEVTTETYSNSPEQEWTIVQHSLEPSALEFKQSVVPYNTLSGYQDPPDNPGIFPRPLGLANRGKMEHVTAWNIRIRGRWCIQANGFGYPMDMDDCEDFVAPWQLWELEEIS